jgi:hypothetical protein
MDDDDYIAVIVRDRTDLDMFGGSIPWMRSFGGLDQKLEENGAIRLVGNVEDI